MLFQSFVFLVFISITLLGHALSRGTVMRWWLLVASYCFYGWGNPWYCLLLMLSTLIDFWVSLRIAATDDPRQRKMWLLVSVFSNLGILASFKYANLFERWLNWTLFGILGIKLPFALPEVLLPVGLSFYTFQTMSYTIDVYRRNMEPTHSFVTMSLYVSFFPQLVAGPIERAQHLMPQLEQKQPRTQDDILVGITRVLWGFVKKLVFADTLGIWVARIWGDPAAATSWELFLAMHAFAFQLYLDFSAYSDIAIGLARIMGVRLQENFRWPFLSRNPLEFFMRWHISLSTWIRDYVYIPLGGSRVSLLRREWNLLVMMLLIGLWHGANEKFLLWGLIHWMYDVAYRTYCYFFNITPDRNKPYSFRDIPASLLTYFLFFPNIFFGAPTLHDAWLILDGLLRWWGFPHFSQPTADVVRVCVFLGIAFVMHFVRGMGLDRPLHAVRSPVCIGLFWAFLLLVIILFHAPDHQPFYYFRF